MELKRLSIIVRGRVQGVGFRYYTEDAALYLGLTGWVRNTWSGEVEIEAQGTPDMLEQFLDRLKEGPPLAHVANILQSEIPVVDGEKNFLTRY